MKDRRDVLKRYQTEIEERLSKVRREKGELQQDILRQADIIVKAVRAAVWSVLSSLHSFTDAAAKRLSREVGDVGDLVGKFDHCISFMDGILEDGFGLPLLFSKTIVETKCRKVRVFQALVYGILFPTTAVIGYAIGLEKMSADRWCSSSSTVLTDNSNDVSSKQKQKTLSTLLTHHK